MRHRIPNYLFTVVVIVLGGLGGYFSIYARQQVAPQERHIAVTAQKYAYDPPVLRVNKGDRVHIKFLSKDVTHGFYLEGYDLDAKARPENPTFWMRKPSNQKDYTEVEEVSFVANRVGKFRYRCSQTCGYMHPFMQGELVVGPNYLYSTSIGMSLGLVVGLLWSFQRPVPGERAVSDGHAK